jgi:hypothetical protein
MDIDSSTRSSADSLLLPPRGNYGVEQRNESYSNLSQRSYGTSMTLSVSRNPSTSSFRSLDRQSSIMSEASLLSTRHDSSQSANNRRGGDESRFSTTRLEQYAHDYDRMRVYRAAEEAGLSSFGITAVDVWIIGASTGSTPGGGESSTTKNNRGQISHSVLWTNPTYCQLQASDALDRLVDPTYAQYVEAHPQVAGAGLAGYFLSLGGGNNNSKSGGLIWRNLHEITSDPLQPPYERMSVLEEAGFGKVTGIPFEIPGGHHHGIVLYFARETADENLLNESSNAQFLRMATQHIGTASALSQPRQASVQHKTRRKHRAFQRIKLKMTCFSAFMTLSGSPKYRKDGAPRDRRKDSQRHGFRFKKLQRTPSDSLLGVSIREGVVKPWIAFTERTGDKIRSWSCFVRDEAKYRVLAAVDKSKGSDIRPPPSLPWLNATWTFAGVFVTLMALVALSDLSTFSLHNQPSLVLAPFGALLTLQYSLTAAPASQPRTIMYAQCICLGTTLLCQHVLMERLAWSSGTVLPLGVATGVAIMTKLGIAHPPAAAAMVAMLDHYRPGETTFGSSVMAAAVLLLANVVAIIASIVVNNLSEQRQYPVYWAMDAGWPTGLVGRTLSRSRIRVPMFCTKGHAGSSNNKSPEMLPLRASTKTVS